jgi:biopolymer transport protein TolR
MGMQIGGSKGVVSPQVNMTPLIDIVLVLLIIFMVLTPQLLKELAVNVPRKAETEIQADVVADQLVVTYTAARTILLNNEPLGTLRPLGANRYDTGEFGARLRDELGKRRTKVVFFNVEDEANYGEAVRVMDICRGAGVKTLGIMTKD